MCLRACVRACVRACACLLSHQVPLARKSLVFLPIHLNVFLHCLLPPFKSHTQKRAPRGYLGTVSCRGQSIRPAMSRLSPWMIHGHTQRLGQGKVTGVSSARAARTVDDHRRCLSVRLLSPPSRKRPCSTGGTASVVWW